MIESFVDLTYRGLSLGRRVKLSQVRPSTGYLETPAPMPVGTKLAIATDDGITLEATVTGIHEQTGGSDKPPGMTVKPALAGEVAETWWRARVSYPEESAAAVVEPAVGRANSKPITVRPRSHTVQEPIVAPEPDGEPTQQTDVIPTAPVIPQGSATTVMDAVDQELLESLSRPSSPELSSPEIARLTRSTGEHEVVDDGKMTTVMEVVDPAALGLLLDEDTGNHQAAPDDKKPGNGGGTVKKRRKKR